ncbi:hypothetical protein Cantr_01051 [Candida viswanathii]|uniref:Uncharacterized protein n=1 Tax=Candida viswanathii TaxID=5486 RepID=A0A367YK04_9ASCO|nr:hypothetical protein Cantr_01051 [Candida viswanathii]
MAAQQSNTNSQTQSAASKDNVVIRSSRGVSVSKTTTDSYAAYPSSAPPPSYGETAPTYAAPAVVLEASPCVKTLTRTYTTVVSYASCRPTDYTPPLDPSDNDCTMYQGSKICGRCEDYYVWVDETSRILTEHRLTDGCRFVTAGSNPHYDYKQTYTMSNGCVEIVDGQYHWVNTETKCPYRKDRCSTTTVYLVSFSSISTFTMCPDSINPPSGCEFTKAPWFPSTYLWCKDA